jgi:hypothetical protein
VLHCLSAFCSQQADVNISLTSIELIWKISDYAANAARDIAQNEVSDSIIESMMTILKEHSTDNRPEVSLKLSTHNNAIPKVKNVM